MVFITPKTGWLVIVLFHFSTVLNYFEALIHVSQLLLSLGLKDSYGRHARLLQSAILGERLIALELQQCHEQWQGWVWGPPTWGRWYLLKQIQYILYLLYKNSKTAGNLPRVCFCFSVLPPSAATHLGFSGWAQLPLPSSISWSLHTCSVRPAHLTLIDTNQWQYKSLVLRSVLCRLIGECAW